MVAEDKIIQKIEIINKKDKMTIMLKLEDLECQVMITELKQEDLECQGI